MACPEGKPLRAAPWCSRRVKCSQHAEPYRLWTASRVGPAANAIPWHMIPSGMTFLRPVCMLGGDCFGLAGPAMTESEPMADTPLPAEFALIARHFRPLAGPGALGLADDAALLAPPPGRELVLTVDAMVGRRAFPARRPAGPRRPQAAAREPVGSCRQGRHADRLPDDRRPPLATRRTPGSPASPPASRRTSGRSASACSAATPPRRPARSALSLTIIGHVAPGADGAARRCAAGRRHLGHRHDRRRRARPGCRPGQAGRPHRPPARPLPSAAAPRGTGDRRHRLRRHGCLGRPGAGPRPSLPRRRPGCRDRCRRRAAVRRRRARPAPTGWRPA